MKQLCTKPIVPKQNEEKTKEISLQLPYLHTSTDWDYNSYQEIQIQTYLSRHDFAPNNYTLPN